MRTLIIAGARLLLGVLLLMQATAHARSDLNYSETLKSVELESTSLKFNAFSRSFDIELEANSRLSKALLQTGQRRHVSAYQGRLRNNDRSWARIVIANGQPRGLIWDGAEMYAVEPSASPADAPVIFRVADMAIEAGSLQCGELSLAGNGAELLQAVVGEFADAAQSGPGAVSQIDVGIIGDFEFTDDKGANATAALMTRMNNIDGIFSEQLAVQLNVALVETFSQNNDPFSDELDSSALLVELANYRQGRTAQNANGLTHLFTGRNLNGSTVGVAYSGALCSTRFGAGLTQATHSDTLDSLIAAHEIGHNFGAPHDGTSGSNCENTAQDFLMAPSLNGSDTFSACSIEQMQDDVARASCISPLAVSEVAVIAGPTQLALLGTVASASFDVSSNGANTATNVAVDISIPGNVTFNSATASSGSCANGAGTVTCTLGSIVGGSSANVTVTTTASNVGNDTFVATATADADTNAANNQASLQVFVDPAVDLDVSATMVSAVTVNQSTTLTLSLQNLATIQASNVSLGLNFAGGVTIDSADWPLGACTINALNVSCDAAAVAAQASSAISIGVTGVTEGTHSYSVTLAADETDIDSANNNTSGNLSVTAVGGGPPPANDDDGGSGAMGSFLLALMTAVGIVRRRRLLRLSGN